MKENKILGFAYKVINNNGFVDDIYKVETYAVSLNKDNTVYYAKLNEFNMNDSNELIQFINNLDQNNYKTLEYWYYEIRSLIEENVIRKSKKVLYGKNYNY